MAVAVAFMLVAIVAIVAIVVIVTVLTVGVAVIAARVIGSVIAMCVIVAV